MLRKKKKKEDKPLLTFTNNKQKLHSKSTYFYSNGKSSCQPSSHNFPNRFEVGLSSLREHAQFPEERGANQTRPSLNNRNLYRKITGWRVSYVLPAMCSIALLLVLDISINPFLPSGGGEEKAYADEAATQAGVNTSIKLTVGNNTLTNATAKAGEVNYLSTTVNVEATDVSGYKMYVQAAPGSSAVLTNGGTKIEGVGSNVATADFGDNKWGYALDATGASVENLAYSTVPENGATLNPAYTTSEVSEMKNFNLAFAAKFGTDAPAGHYGTNVLLSVAVDAETVGGFYNIEYMQDMTTAICNQAYENDTKQLIDKRDNKKYWVTKLRDGNCWMTQNLDLDITTTGLKAIDTDITEDWNSSTNSIYPPVATGTGDRPNIPDSSGYVVASYDPGFMICNASICTKVDEGSARNSHYSVGNYYTWNAAKAGRPNIDYDGSICPKAWVLPVSISGLFGSYGARGTGVNASFYGSQNVMSEPLYFTLVGWAQGSSINLQGGFGFYALNNTPTPFIVGGSTSPREYWGVSVRCVAR